MNIKLLISIINQIIIISLVKRLMITVNNTINKTKYFENRFKIYR
jgi:hypothetical protein